MTSNLQKEEFSIAYLHTLVSVAGLKLQNIRIDDNSIDCTIDSSIPSTGEKGTDFPDIKVQLKATSKNIVKDGIIKFQLKKKNYDELRTPKVTTPRFLIILLLPQNNTPWIKEESDKTELYHKLYYTSLKGRPPLSGEQQSVSIEIPLDQTLTVDILKDMFNKFAKEGV